ASLGRAMMTEDAIYVPLNDTIVKLGLGGDEGAGDVQAEMKVRLGTGAPLGNLYSDGERIWVVGANRLYALGPDDGSDSEKEEEPSDKVEKDAEAAEDKKVVARQRGVGSRLRAAVRANQEAESAKQEAERARRAAEQAENEKQADDDDDGTP
ncbi:MAG: hypothetical protein ACR2NP_10870, partial [Pirellulaceae bacterium]